jgi:DNA-binding response OmpR family regulator
MSLSALVVDYDPDILRLVEIKLRRAGYRVLTAASGDQGLALVRSARPDVLVAELLLPGCDGARLVAETKRELGAAAPIAILLGRGESEADIVAALACGADDYLVKPFSPRELLARITVARVRAGRFDGAAAGEVSAVSADG